MEPTIEEIEGAIKVLNWCQSGEYHAETIDAISALNWIIEEDRAESTRRAVAASHAKREPSALFKAATLNANAMAKGLIVDGEA